MTGKSDELRSPGTPYRLAALCLMGWLVRLYGVGQRSLFPDELLLWQEATTGVPYPHTGPAVPFFFRIFMSLTRAMDETSLHLVAATIGVLVIPLSFRMATMVAGRSVGWIHAILVTLSPVLLYWTTALRPYPFFVVSATLLYLTFLRSLRANTTASWALYSFSVVLGLLIHLVTFQILFAFFIFLLLSCFPAESRKEKLALLKRFTLVTALSSAVGASWILFRGGGTLSVLEGTPQTGVLQFLRMAFIGLGVGNFYGVEGLTAIDGISLVLLGLCAYGAFKSWKGGSQDTAALFSLVIAVCLGVLFFTLGPKWTWRWYRYIAQLTILYLLFVAIAIHSIAARLSRYQRPILVVLLGALLLPGLMHWFESASSPRSPQKLFSDLAMEQERKVDGILLSGATGWEFGIFMYYYRGTRPVYVIENDRIGRFAFKREPGWLAAQPIVAPVKPGELKDGRYAAFLAESSSCDLFQPQWGAATTAPLPNPAPYLCDVKFSRAWLDSKQAEDSKSKSVL